MAFGLRGERFNVDLSSDEDEQNETSQRPKAGTVARPFVKDITERAQAKPVVAPVAKPASTGFPSHRKRTVSRFKQQSSQAPARPVDERHALNRGVQDDGAGIRPSDREDIDNENRGKLSKMSPAEIDAAREELMSNLSPSLVQKLLQRGNITEPQESDFPSLKPQTTETIESTKNPSDKHSRASTGSPENDTILTKPALVPPPPGTSDINSNSLESPATESQISTPSIHFPKPPESPLPDPTSPNFLEELHEKYFPELAHDPSKLAWMDPSTSTAAQSNAYAATTSTLPIAALRFSFTGALLPPSVSNSIPTNKGLHHHGDSPDAAGYTIAELAHLARSAFPSQRCVAFQTLGRILYRLGVGEFGKLQRGFESGTRVFGDEQEDEEGEDEEVDEEQSLRDLAKGLWDCVREGRVLETLEAEASREGGHVSAKAYATEALWLWRKGGGTEVRAT